MPRAVRACSLLLGALASYSTEARAQLACTPTNQAGLLAQFSDSASPGSIAPSNVRNVICSMQNQQGTGGAVQVQSPSTSPFTFTAVYGGTLIVGSGAVAISRDNGQTWLPVSVSGGAIPVLVNDQVQVTWYQTVPTITFLPSGPSQ